MKGKIVRIRRGMDGKNFRILEVVKVTKTGRMNLSDGTVLNPDFTERGGSYGAWDFRPKYTPLTKELEIEIKDAEKRSQLNRLLSKFSVKDASLEDVEKLIAILAKQEW